MGCLHWQDSRLPLGPIDEIFGFHAQRAITRHIISRSDHGSSRDARKQPSSRAEFWRSRPRSATSGQATALRVNRPKANHFYGTRPREAATEPSGGAGQHQRHPRDRHRNIAAQQPQQHGHPPDAIDAGELADQIGKRTREHPHTIA